jgi:hypothetical protein
VFFYQNLELKYIPIGHWALMVSPWSVPGGASLSLLMRIWCQSNCFILLKASCECLSSPQTNGWSIYQAI